MQVNFTYYTNYQNKFLSSFHFSINFLKYLCTQKCETDNFHPCWKSVDVYKQYIFSTNSSYCLFEVITPVAMSSHRAIIAQFTRIVI